MKEIQFAMFFIENAHKIKSVVVNDIKWYCVDDVFELMLDYKFLNPCKKGAFYRGKFNYKLGKSVAFCYKDIKNDKGKKKKYFRFLPLPNSNVYVSKQPD